MRFWGFSDFFKLFDSKKSYAAGENSHVRLELHIFIFVFFPHKFPLAKLYNDTKIVGTRHIFQKLEPKQIFQIKIDHPVDF